MQRLEKFIYSFKYLPPILYFGSVDFGYDIYCNVINETEFLDIYTETLVIIIFCLMTYLGVKTSKEIIDDEKKHYLYYFVFRFFLLHLFQLYIVYK